MKYSLLLPVYNELQNLPLILYLLYQTAVYHQLEFEVIIVEDNSPDHTRKMAKKLIQFYQKMASKVNHKFSIVLIERQKKLGLGSAYLSGIKACTAQYVIIMDADLSHHPKYIPQMISSLIESKADIVCSTRYVENGGVQGWNFSRKLTSRTANYIASFFLQSDFTDLTGSFRLYRKQVLEQLMGMTKTKGYAFQMEILISAWKMKKKIVEQPIIFVDRLYGKSKLGPNEVFLYLKGVLHLFIDY